MRIKVVQSVSLALVLLTASLRECPAAVIAKDGVAKTVIVLDPTSSPTERFAAQQLAGCLREITGGSFVIQTNAKAPRNAIIVGSGAAARSYFRDVPFAQLGGEEFVIRTAHNRILLAGGRPRGTLYAVSRFLQDECGVRWWTPWASRIPKKPSMRMGAINVRAKPAFDYRNPYWRCAFDPEWGWHNLCNSESSHLTAEQGGSIQYKYFVHSFYTLVPPQKYFSPHPEWFSLINGRRTSDDAQLCLSNPELRDFVVDRVKEALRESPEARIVSVSQNDSFNWCECTNCKALDDAEGSHSGSVIAFVNYIAGKIAPEFPNVAVDTLAYQYTRKPPKTLTTRSNVIVRLCSIECNFREPLDSPSNSAFAADIRGWDAQANRLYAWDYVTDFAHYIQPFPDWFTLAPNLRFFQDHKVRGVFEEGASESYGTEMAEMRAWVLAQLLWNPRQNDKALIREFLDGYYGAAGWPLWRYLELMEEASKGSNLTIGTPTDAPFLHFKALAQAESLWREAEDAVKGDDELLKRAQQGHLAVQYVWLAQWDALRAECVQAGAVWPFAVSREDLGRHWLAVAHGVEEKPWTKVTIASEGGTTPDQFIAKIGQKKP